MSDKVKGILEKIFLAGIGAMAITAEKAKEIINEMITRGELSVEQGKAINEELKRAMKNREEDNSPLDDLSKLDNLDEAQLAILKARILDIENKRMAAAAPTGTSPDMSGAANSDDQKDIM